MVGAGTTPFRRDQCAHKAELAELGQFTFREPRLAVALRRARRKQVLRDIARGIAQEDLFFGQAHRAILLLGRLFLKSSQTVTKALMLSHHRAHLLKHVYQRVFVTQDDCSQNMHIFPQAANVLAHRRLLGEHPLNLSAKEFERDVVSHMRKLASRPPRVNHAVSLKSSRPISMRRISEVPAPIS